MGDSRSAMYDDHSSYVQICKILKVKALGIGDDESFYTHQRKLLDKHKCKNEYDFFAKFQKKK